MMCYAVSKPSAVLAISRAASGCADAGTAIVLQVESRDFDFNSLLG